MAMSRYINNPLLIMETGFVFYYISAVSMKQEITCRKQKEKTIYSYNRFLGKQMVKNPQVRNAGVLLKSLGFLSPSIS